MLKNSYTNYRLALYLDKVTALMLAFMQDCEPLLFIVDLSSWHKKISEEMELEFDDEDVEVGETIEVSIIQAVQQFLLSCERFPYDSCLCLLEVSDSSPSIIIIVRIGLQIIYAFMEGNVFCSLKVKRNIFFSDEESGHKLH
jgi:hypothetical protein